MLSDDEDGNGQVTVEVGSGNNNGVDAVVAGHSG